MKKIGIVKDFEKKHVELIKEMALKGENGSKFKLPFDVTAIKEYDYITLVNKHKEEAEFNAEFKCGEINVPNFGKLLLKRVKNFEKKDGVLYVDYRKIPKTAMWRYREDGDMFTKFGGGTKKLKSYLIDKKIPQRLRKYIPVLADENDVLVIGGVEISDKVKMDGSPTGISIEVKIEK